MHIRRGILLLLIVLLSGASAFPAQANPTDTPSSNPRELVVMDGVLYFITGDGSYYAGLWRLDETGQPQRLPLEPALAVSITQLRAYAGRLAFRASRADGEGVFAFDPATYNLVKLLSLPAGVPCRIEAAGGTLYILLSASGELWKSSGSGEATLLATFSPQPTLQSLGGVVYLSGVRTDLPDLGRELWLANAAGVLEGKDLCATCSSAPEDFTLLDGQVYFTANASPFVRTLWVTDGTAAGTHSLAPDGHAPDRLTTYAGELAFLGEQNGQRTLYAWSPQSGSMRALCADAGALPDCESLLGHAMTALPWLTGSPHGLLVSRSGVQDGYGVLYGLRKPAEQAALLAGDGAAVDGANRYGLQAALGTAFLFEGLQDGQPGLWAVEADGASLRLLAAGLTTGADAPAVWDDRLYFAAQDEAHGSELWVSDGTPAGTHLVADLGIRLRVFLPAVGR